MKKNVVIFLCLFPFLITAHPIRMSLLYIDYTPEDHSIYLECRLFGDDMKMAIEEEMSSTINLEDYWTDTEQKTVNTFIKKHIKVSFGNRTLALDFNDYEYNSANNVVTLRYEFSSLILKTGEQVIMSNDLFFKQFRQDQTNIFQLEIPNVAETTIQCDMNNFTQIFTIE